MTGTDDGAVTHTVNLSDQEAAILKILLQNALDHTSPEQHGELLGLSDKIPEAESTATKASVRRRYSR